MKRLFLLFGFCVALLGCTRNDLDRSRPEEVRGLLLTTSEVGYEPWFSTNAGLVREPLSKVTESNFQALDTIGVFIYTGAINAGPYHSTNMIYYTKDGTPDGTTSPQWTAATAMGGALNSGTAYNSTAYYPYQKRATNASSVVHSVAADQSAAAVAGSARALERSDFMWAPPVAVANPATAPAAKFTFQHLLTKLVVSLQVPSMIDGVAATKLNSVTIKNLNTTASIDLGSGVLNNLTDKQNIKPRWLSGNGNPGTVSVYEAIVVPQTAASGVVLVEVKCQTASGEKVANYFPAASGLVLGGGKKITLTLTAAADIAITSELDLVTGQAYTDLALKLKVASGTAWTLTAPTGSWISLASAAGGSYGATVTGAGTGVDQTVYVKAAANTGAGAAPRQAVLTLSAKIAGVDRSVTYTAVQNYSKPVVGFPTTNLIMDALNAQLPAVSGNSNWYIKAANLPRGVRLSRRNVNFNELVAGDTIALHSLSNTGPKEGYMVSGNYFNSNGVLYLVVDPQKTLLFSMVCNGVNVSVDARSILVTSKAGKKLRWARGHLIATSSVQQGVATGTNGSKVKIGDPYDGGMLFAAGSLIGWKGGSAEYGGTGVGPLNRKIYNQPLVTPWTTTEEATTFSWSNDVMVWPLVFTNGPTGIGTIWPYSDGENKYYFGLGTGDWSMTGKNIADFPGFTDGSLASATCAVGDPCRYYLGGKWRTPTTEDWSDLLRNKYPNGTVGDIDSWNVGIPWGNVATWNQEVMAVWQQGEAYKPGWSVVYANTKGPSLVEAQNDPQSVMLASGGLKMGPKGCISYCNIARMASNTIGGSGVLACELSSSLEVRSSWGSRNYARSVRCVSDN